MKAHRLFFILAALLAFAGFVGARPVRFPTCQDLLGKSDLVVIATPIATADTKEQINLPDVINVYADNTHSGVSVIGMETKFRVSAVLKGERSLKDFVLHHYRETNMSGSPASEGVALVTFDPAEPASFLLFLVHEPDGRYAPFNQTDPGLLSVQKLTTNTQDDENKPAGL